MISIGGMFLVQFTYFAYGLKIFQLKFYLKSIIIDSKEILINYYHNITQGICNILIIFMLYCSINLADSLIYCGEIFFKLRLVAVIDVKKSIFLIEKISIFNKTPCTFCGEANSM